MTLHACLAPGLAPGMVRVVRMKAGGPEYDTIAELTPDQARKLARGLEVTAAVAVMDRLVDPPHVRKEIL